MSDSTPVASTAPSQLSVPTAPPTASILAAGGGAALGGTLAAMLATAAQADLLWSPVLAVGLYAGSLSGLAGLQPGLHRWWMAPSLGLLGALVYVALAPVLWPAAVMALGLCAIPAFTSGAPSWRDLWGALGAGCLGAAAMYSSGVILSWLWGTPLQGGLLAPALAAGAGGLLMGLPALVLGRGENPGLNRDFAETLALVGEGPLGDLVRRIQSEVDALREALGHPSVPTELRSIPGQLPELVAPTLATVRAVHGVRPQLEPLALAPGPRDQELAELADRAESSRRSLEATEAAAMEQIRSDLDRLVRLRSDLDKLRARFATAPTGSG